MVLSQEMDYAMKNLAMPDGSKPYFMGYTITDRQNISINAGLGALIDDFPVLKDGH